MKNKLKELVSKKAKGGIESILGVVILVGLVVILIIAVIMPMVNNVQSQGSATTNDLNNLRSSMDAFRD